MISMQHAHELRAIIETQALNLTDEQALTAIEFFPKWNESNNYSKDDRVRYQGILYKCLQDHTAQSSWTPTDAPSLWSQVLIDPSGEPLPWTQPDSTNPYMKGDRVTHNDQTWESTVDNNVWEPGVYGWQVV